MRHSRSPRVSAAVLALAMLGSACARLGVKDDVAIKAVPIDLTFGAKLPATPEPLPPPGRLDLPPLELDFPTQKPPPVIRLEDICPPVTALGARDIAPSVMNDREYDPKQAGDPNNGTRPIPGSYLFRFTGNFSEKEEEVVDGYKEISQIASREVAPGDPFARGFTYYVQDEFPGFQIQFEVVPQDASRTDRPPGFYFREIGIPDTEGGSHLLFFRATPSLRILRFPIDSDVGKTFTESSPDTAVKSDTGVPGLVTPARDVIISTVTIGSRDTIDVCAEREQAWMVSWLLEIRGGFDITIAGTFWLATEFGGLPIKETYVVDGGLIQGNFSSNMMRLDPGDYL